MLFTCFNCSKEFKKNHTRKSLKHYCSIKCRRFRHEKCINCLCVMDYSKAQLSNKLCRKCYWEEYRKKNPEFSKNKTKREYIRLRIKKGLAPDHPRLKKLPGEPWVNNDGYVYIRKNNHPNAQKNGTIYQHIWVMSEHIGRPLREKETVHHKNGIRHDNRIENLELWSKDHPPGQRVSDKLKFYKEFIESYGGKVDLQTIPDVIYEN